MWKIRIQLNQNLHEIWQIDVVTCHFCIIFLLISNHILSGCPRLETCDPDIGPHMTGAGVASTRHNARACTEETWSCAHYILTQQPPTTSTPAPQYTTTTLISLISRHVKYVDGQRLSQILSYWFPFIHSLAPIQSKFPKQSFVICLIHCLLPCMMMADEAAPVAVMFRGKLNMMEERKKGFTLNIAWLDNKFRTRCY